jgi:hypothetical protein
LRLLELNKDLCENPVEVTLKVLCRNRSCKKPFQGLGEKMEHKETKDFIRTAIEEDIKTKKI